MIHIINYGLGNLGSVQNMLRRLGAESIIASSPNELKTASKLILPGVGAFDSGMSNLKNQNWLDTLNQLVVQQQIPILGICLGMQLMTRSSEEGILKGMGWVNAVTKKFPPHVGKIPHMGWNVSRVTKETPLVSSSEGEQRFYFVHSYYVELQTISDEILSTSYGIDFTAGFQVGNIFGVQFHPEKSHRYGMSLLANFVNNF